MTFKTEVTFTDPDGFKLSVPVSDGGTAMHYGKKKPSPDEFLIKSAKALLIKQGGAKEEEFETFSSKIERQELP